MIHWRNYVLATNPNIQYVLIDLMKIPALEQGTLERLKSFLIFHHVLFNAFSFRNEKPKQSCVSKCLR